MGYVKLISAIAFIAATAWVIARPGFDSIVAALVCLTALVGAFAAERRRRSQHQSVSGSSTGIQAGRDATS